MKNVILFGIYILVFSNAVFCQNYSKELEIYREKYKSNFLSEENGPLKNDDIKYLDFYEADSSFKVLCTFIKSKSKKPFEIPTSSGKNKVFVTLGYLKFNIRGNQYKLAVYQNVLFKTNPLYKNYLFVPFKDLSNNIETYGGGRYLDFDLLDLKKDIIYLDFNKAYNPYCAYSDGYSCPIPPKENHLNLEIKAGEKNFLRVH
jgi:uncharacterized protein